MKKLIISILFFALTVCATHATEVGDTRTHAVNTGSAHVGKVGVKTFQDPFSQFAWAPDGAWRDPVSGQPLGVDLAAGRFNDVSGLEIGLNEKNTDPDGSLNLGPDAYEQLGFATENTSLWSGSGPWTITINVTEIATHTLSTNLNGATVSIAAGTATIDGPALATYGNDDQFEVTGAGTIIVTTDTEDPKYQVTASTYRFPYAPNLSAVSTLLVPSNNSGPASGYSYEIKEDLRNSLDGVADGVDIVVNGTFESDTDWNKSGDAEINNGTGRILTDGAGAFSALAQTTLISGVYYELFFDIVAEPTVGSGLKAEGGTVVIADNISGVGTKGPYRFIPDTTRLRIGRQAGVTDIRIDNVIVKQISDAKGELVKTIIPMFNAGDIGAIVNIATANDEETSFFLYDDINELLTAYDGTNTATVAFSPVNGTEYEIRLMYGDNSGSKMRVAVDAVYGTEVTFAGTFPNDTHLKLGYGSEWFKMKTRPQWFKEVQSSW